MSNDTRKHNEIEDHSIKLAKRLVYSYIFLGIIDGLLLSDLSPDYTHLMIGVTIIYSGLSVLIGWLILNSISKKIKKCIPNSFSCFYSVRIVR